MKVEKESRNSEFKFVIGLNKNINNERENDKMDVFNNIEEGKGADPMFELVNIVDEKNYTPQQQQQKKVIPLPSAYKNKKIEKKIEDKFKNDESIKEVKYTPGLHLFGSEKKERKTLDDDDKPLLKLNRLEGLDDIKGEEEKLKHELKSRPESASLRDYSSMPVDDFGKALLRGMGWKEGGTVGLSNPVNVKPIEYVPRVGRLGLGAEPKVEDLKDKNKKKLLKPGEKEIDRTLVAPLSEDGKVRHYRTVDEKLVEAKPKSLHVGCHVEIISGIHKDMLGKVHSLDRDFVTVTLRNDVNVKVEIASVRMLNEVEYKRKRSPDIVSIVDEKPHKKKDKKDKKEKKEKKRRKEEYWLTPNIIVRIISKKFSSGKHYNQKVLIVDVYKKDECQVQLPDGKLIDGVKQEYLETVCPRVGDRVLIIKGKAKGRSATIIEKDSNKNKVIVQTQDDKYTLTFDDISSIQTNK